MSLDGFLASMPNESKVSIFNHEKACGFSVQWAETGMGFGEFVVALDKETGEVRVDTEGMAPEWIGTMLERLVGTVVKDIHDEQPRMVITDPDTVAHIQKLTDRIRNKS